MCRWPLCKTRPMSTPQTLPSRVLPRWYWVSPPHGSAQICSRLPSAAAPSCWYWNFSCYNRRTPRPDGRGLRKAEHEVNRRHEVGREHIKLNADPRHQCHTKQPAERNTCVLFCQQQAGCGLPYYCGTRCGGQARRSTVPPARSRLFSAIRAENESGSGRLRSCSVNLAEYAVKMA